MKENLQSFITYWDSLGWLANFLAVAVPSISVLYFLYGRFWKKSDPKYDYSNFQSYIEAENKSWGVDRIKQKKIIIVDDDPDNYPLDYLRSSGFKITSLERISLNNIEQLMNYDLIVLDITGIVEEDMQRGGFEVLKRIKKMDQEKLVIGASSKRYDPTLTEFFKLSDRQIKTPVDPTNLEKIFLEILLNKYNPAAIAKDIDEFLSNKKISNSERAKVIKISISYVNGEISEDKFFKKLNIIISSKDMCRYDVLLDKLKNAL